MKKMAIFKSRTIRNAGWLIAGRVIQMAVNFFVGLLSARYLGPSNYGLIGYADAFTAFCTALCTLGINSVLVKEFIDHPGEEGKILGTTLGLQAISSICSAISIICIVSIVNWGEPLTILVVALANIGMIFRIVEAFNCWFHSRLESRVTASATLAAYLVSAAYKVYLMITGKGVAWFALVSSLDYLCMGLLLLWAYHRAHGGRLCFSWSYGKTVLRKSCHFILPSLMIAIYGQTDKLMLKQMIDATEIGYYQTAVSLCGVWCFVLSAIIDSVNPSIMEVHAVDHRLFEKRNRQLYAVVFYLSMFVSLGFTVLARPIISILYGSAYLPTVSPLRIITWYTAFSYLGVARNAWIVCENKQKYLLPVYASAAAANVVFNLILIPVWGASGAALASLMAQIITTMVTPFFIPGLRRNSVLMVEAMLLRGVR